MIEELLSRLTAAGLDLELRELRDALWLAPHVVPGAGTASGFGPAPGPKPNERVGAEPGWSEPPAADPSAQPADADASAARTELHAAGRDGRSLHAMEARSPGVPALRHQLQISRALRPLKRRVPSRTRYLLDEDATAARAAEEGLWFPVFRPAPARWLELELVIDTAPSMSVWRRTSAELETLVERLGAFRSIRTSALDTDADSAQPLALHPGPPTQAHVHQPRDLTTPIEPARSRTILVVTDAIGSAWRDGRMDTLLRSWAAGAPTAVVTMLPQHMWAGSGLRAVPGQLRRSASGMADRTVQSRAQPGPGPVAGPAPVAVMELSARWLAPWADLLAGSSVWRNAALLRAPEAAVEPQPDLVQAQSPTEVVRQFRASASPTAFQLACYLSAAGLSLPVMRLVQRVMLPESDTVHLAEVFLSGLLHAMPAAEAAREDIAQYDFVPGVRDELSNCLLRDEMLEVVRETSRFVAERFGQPLDFSALLTDPEGAPLPVLAGGTGQPLAYVSVATLAKLGGRYQILADRLAATASAAPAAGTTTSRRTGPAQASSAAEQPAGGSQGAPSAAGATTTQRPTPAAGNRASRPAEVRGRPYFYLSYARTPKRDPADKDDPDRWVHKLYKDLCTAILHMTDAQPDEVGFMDRENRLGAEWSPELETALGTCRTFVPLYSRRYFESDSCGREWFAFARREATLSARGQQAASSIIPAMWTRLDRDRLPPVAQSLQHDFPELGERYLADGFYGIMKLQNYRADYQRAVHRLAERIVTVADEGAAVPVPTDIHQLSGAGFASLPSAFGPSSARRTADGALQLAVLAPDISLLPPGRASEYYGSTAQAWAPYRPDYRQPVVDYAVELAKKCLDCTPVVGTVEGIRRPASYGPVIPALVMVDPWAVFMPELQEQLRALDEITEPWVSVLVPWNAQDAAMSEARDDLHEKLRLHIGRRLASVPRRCQMAAAGIPTLEDFGQLLPEMTMIMLKRFRREATAHPPAGPVIERPRLRAADPGDTP